MKYRFSNFLNLILNVKYISGIRKANPMVDSIIPSPLASEKVNTIGGRRTVVKPQKKLEILSIETNARSHF